MNIAFPAPVSLLMRVKLLLMCLLATACVQRSMASDYPREPSYAYKDTADTPLARAIQPRVAAHPGKSGFQLITTGGDAFEKRIALIRSARRSIDLQYYIVHGDETGTILLQELLFAADRGVRVRMLVDEMYIDEIDDSVSVMNAHPNVEIRAFNPRSLKGSPPFARVYNYLFDWDRVTRRMHNKAMISDNQAAIMGGRNLGDEYFDADQNFNFSDIDVVAVGPVVPGISNSFDRYWNSESSYPLRALKLPVPNDELKQKVRDDMISNREKLMQTPLAKYLRKPQFHEELKADKIKLIWAKASVVVDEPIKIEDPDAGTHSKPAERIDALVDHANKEFIAISAYFVPREEGVAWLRQVTDRGISVRMLTNSLASTDVAAVHAGYRRYREDLLRSGVELYEFKPRGKPKQKFRGSFSPASLHAKVYVIDRAHVVVGSFNLDPRSIELNTELMLTIHSTELAGQIVKMFEEATLPSESYRVVLAPVSMREGAPTDAASASVHWVTEEKGREVTYDHEPGAGFISHAVAGVAAILPVEDQL